MILKTLLSCCIWMMITIVLAAPQSYNASITIHPTPSGAVSPYIYGQYLEHVDEKDECIYPSLWDSASPKALPNGVRTDTADAIRQLSTPIVRWPGGCFADLYHWQDAIGPHDQRRPKPNLHWGGTEPNMFGTDEFLSLCELTGMEPHINVNIGTGTPEEAAAWVEYCNGPTTSPYGLRRSLNGRPTPYNVKHWGVGNETWGHWEAGHADAETYATSLTLYARAMRAVDPTVKILAVGSEEGNDPAWDRTVLARAGSHIDYLTFHGYGISDTLATGTENAKAEALAFTPVYFENRLKRMIDTIAHSPTDAGTTRTIPISIDEWNVRRYNGKDLNRREPRTQADAVFVAGMLNTMIRLSPHVGMANYVFLINGHAPIRVEGDEIITSPLFHVFQKYRQQMIGERLEVTVDGPSQLSPSPTTAHPGRKPASDYSPKLTPAIDAVATLQPDKTITLSLINRSATTTASVHIKLPDGYHTNGLWTMAAATPAAIEVTPTDVPVPKTNLTLPPLSINLIRILQRSLDSQGTGRITPGQQQSSSL